MKVVKGEVDASREKAHLGKRTGWLRACQIKPLSDCIVEIAERSLAPVVRTELDSAATAEVLPHDAAVAGYDVRLPEATLTDNISDFDRLARALPVDASKIDLAAARQLPPALREGKWSLRVHIREAELIGFTAAGRRTLGLAIDLGTTNVAGFLVDLESGVRVASLGIENPQVAWGADVISRMRGLVGAVAPVCASTKRTSPALGRRSPRIICNKVLLPQPLGPITAVTRWGSIRKLTRWSASIGAPDFALYVRLTS